MMVDEMAVKLTIQFAIGSFANKLPMRVNPNVAKNIDRNW
jgi:hypothetical protein